MENIAPIDEDYLYNLSYAIEPIKESDSDSDEELWSSLIIYYQ